MARIRIDWQKIRAGIPEEDMILVLDRQAINVFLSIMHIFEWRALFRVDDYDFADWDDVQRILSEAEASLGTAMRIQELVPYIDDIETLLTELRDKDICCDAPVTFKPPGIDKNSGSDIEDDTGPPPTEWGGEPIADWDAWREYKCEAAYEVVSWAAATMRNLADLEELDTPLTADTIAEVLSYIPLIGEFVAVLWYLSFELADQAWDLFADFETAATQIEAAEDEIACAIYQADGPDTAAAAMKTEVQTAVAGLFTSIVAEYLAYDMWMHWVYEGTATDVEGNTQDIGALLTPGTHDCCVDPNEFDLTFVFDSDLGIWSVFTTGSASIIWDSFGNPDGSCRLRSNNQTQAIFSLIGNDLVTDQGWTGVTSITVYELHWQDYPEFSFSGNFLVQIDGNVQAHPGWTDVEWVDRDWIGLSIEQTNLANALIRIEDMANSSSYRSHWVDNIRIVGRYD